MNLSSKDFTKAEFKTLGYNLNFIPTPDKPNKKQLEHDIKQFSRRIKLRDHFGVSQPVKPIFKSKSSWEPSENHHTVKTFLEDFSKKVRDEFDNVSEPASAKTSNNLNKQERQALEHLKTMDDIVITNADKGGAVVVQDVQNYVEEAMRQLNDQSFYRRLNHNPTSEHPALVENAIDGLRQKEFLDEKTAECLKPTNPKTPKLYLLPKIHKEGNPGRPVVSSVDCHTEKISAFVDYHLQPMNKELESYVQDTTDFIKKLESLNPEDNGDEPILVTMDVRSLYTTIPNDEGKEAIKEFFEKRSRPGDSTLSKVIQVFLSLILTLNNFVFNETNYLQINGCSMGTKCAPTYASLYMGWFERKYILPRIQQHVSMYVRYIDDIFFVWKGPEHELKKFLETINTLHPSIKFDYKYSKESTDFLDTTVKLVNKAITTTLYTKPTDRKAFLHAKSYHPSSTKKAIAFSQASRLRRICSDPTDFWRHATKLKEDLLNRGYREEELSREIERAARIERSDLLKYKDKSTSNRIPLIVTYNRQLPNLKKILDSTWNHLSINPEVQRKFVDKPIVCYKKNRSLRDEIGQTRLAKGRVVRKKSNKKGRCSPCMGRSDCLCCRHLISTSVFTNRNGQAKYEIWHRMNCHTKNALYLAFCMKCNARQYVGKVETQGANRRVNKHRNDVRRPDGLAIDRHFDQPDHDFNRDFRLILIEEITKRNLTKEQMRELLLRREDFWMLKLDTLAPNGFNDKLNFPAEARAY